MLPDVVRGSTEQVIRVCALKTDGTRYTGLAAGSVAVRYALNTDSTVTTQATLNEMTLPTFVQFGWQEQGSGWYAFGLPNAPLANATAKWLDLDFAGPVDMEPMSLRVTISGNDFHASRVNAQLLVPSDLPVLRKGAVVSSTPSGNNYVVTLDSQILATDRYLWATIWLYPRAAVANGVIRTILAWDASTKTATVLGGMAAIPDSTWDYAIIATHQVGRSEEAVIAGVPSFPTNFSSLKIGTDGIVWAKDAYGNDLAQHSQMNTVYGRIPVTVSPQTVWSYATRALTDKAGFSLAADQSAVTVGTVSTLVSFGAYVAPPTVTQIRQEMDSNSIMLAAVKSKTDNLPDQPAAVGSEMVLAANGLDQISVVGPAGVATSFREMVVQLWRWFFKKKDVTTTAVRTYADDGTTIVTIQAVSESTGTQTVGSAQ